MLADAASLGMDCYARLELLLPYLCEDAIGTYSLLAEIYPLSRLKGKEAILWKILGLWIWAQITHGFTPWPRMR